MKFNKLIPITVTSADVTQSTLTRQQTTCTIFNFTKYSNKYSNVFVIYYFVLNTKIRHNVFCTCLVILETKLPPNNKQDLCKCPLIKRA